MTNITPAKLSAMIEKKLSHNFGVAPEQASDELFYKASVLSLLEGARYCRLGKGESVIISAPLL